jgi:integrase
MSRRRDRYSALGLLPRMEARPRKDGLITFRYQLPAVGECKARAVNLGTDREAAIRQALDLAHRASDQGTWGQLWRLYVASAEFGALAERTRASYREYWGQLGRVFERGIVSATRPADVARYLRVERAHAPVRANREVAVLSNLANMAVERGDIDRNPCRDVRRNKEHPRTRLVESAELEAFVSWALQQGRSAVVLVSMAQFAALTGNRRAEFLRLHWPQVDKHVIRLKRAKQHGGAELRELVSISAALQEVIDRMRALPGYSPMGAVFRAPKTGNPYSEAGFKAMWARLIAAALAQQVVATRFTFHDLRAHYASYYMSRPGRSLGLLWNKPGTLQYQAFRQSTGVRWPKARWAMRQL